MDGWIKLHRCLLDKAVWQNPNVFRVFSWCLLKATHKPLEQMLGMTKVMLVPGQFIFGRHSAARECGMKPSTVVDCMSWLKSNTTIDIKPSNKFSLVTVMNWALYQSSGDESDTSSDIKSDNTPTSSRQQADTNKNLKNVKNTYREFYPNPELQQAMIGFIEMRKLKAKKITDHAIDLLMKRLDKMTTVDAVKVEILNRSTINSWSDLYELKVVQLPVKANFESKRWEG